MPSKQKILKKIIFLRNYQPEKECPENQKYRSRDLTVNVLSTLRLVLAGGFCPSVRQSPELTKTSNLSAVGLMTWD